jgi:cytochrome c oxidase subunit 2
MATEGDEDPRMALGRAVFEEEYCSSCHRIDGAGETKGPDLSHIGSRLQEGYLREWVSDPEAFRPETIMPAVQASGKKLDNLVYYLMSHK